LATGSGQGTGFHEAFHAIFRYGLSDEEVNFYLKASERDLKNKFTPKEIEEKLKDLRSISDSYSKLSSKELYNMLLEEHLAEEFRKWKSNKPVKSAFKSLFRRLIDLVKSLLRVNNELETLFGSIDRGDFATKVATPNSLVKINETVFKNIPAGPNTKIPQARSKKIINTYAALLVRESKSSDKSVKDLKLTTILDKLLDERLENLKTTGISYVESLPDGVLKDRLENQIISETYSLENEEARKLLKSFVLKRVKTFDIEVEETNMGTKDSWMLSINETLPKQIREYISFAMYKELDPITNKMVDIAVDDQIIFNGLSHALANTPEDQILQKWVAYAQDNPQAKAVLDMVMSDSGMTYDNNGIISNPVKNFNDVRRVIAAFKRFKVRFEHTAYNIKNDFVTGNLISNKVETYNANTKTPASIQLNNWYNNLKYILEVEQVSFDEWNKRSESVQKSIKVLNKELVTKIILDDEKLREQVKNIKDSISKFGIDLSSGYIKYSLLKSKGDAITEDQKVYISNWNVEPLDFSLFFNNKYGIQTFLTSLDSDGQVKSPYDEDGIKTRIKDVAEANSSFDESIGSSNFKGPDGETRYDIVLSSYMLSENVKLKDPAYRKLLIEKYPILKDNLFINNESLINDLQIGIVSDVRDHGKKDSKGKVFGDFSEREYLAQILGFWFSSPKKENNKRKFIFRQNEASNTAYLAELPIQTLYNNKITEKAIDTIYGFFNQEFDRINRSNVEYPNGDGKIKGYNDSLTGRAYRFTEFEYLLEELGPDLYGEITSQAKEGKKLDQDTINKIKFAITNKMAFEMKNFLITLEDNGFIKLGKNGRISYNKLLPTNAGSDVSKLTDQINNLYLNDYINSFSMNQLFDGDYALSRTDKKGIIYKDKNGVEYPNIIVSSTPINIDIVKRNKGAMGSGPDLGYGTHRVAYIKDINDLIKSKPVNNNLERVKEKGEGVIAVNGNDAQSYTNINHIIFMTNRLGRANPKAIQILRKIRRGISITQSEQEHLQDSQVSLNPWKTITFGREHYIKTSEAVIDRHEVSYLPKENVKEYNDILDKIEHIEDTREDANITGLMAEASKLFLPLPGKELYHNILNQMDIHGIDQVVAESASKGATITPVDSQEVNMDLSLSMEDIPNEYKKLQVETPTGKLEITSGTQLMQLIDSEQKDDFKVGNQTLGEIRNEYRKNMANTRYNSFQIAKRLIQELEDGSKDISKLQSKFLISLENSGADDQMIELFGMNWNLMSIHEKAEQLFLSHFSSGVLSQKVPGTKVSLMSDSHWKVIVDQNGKIIPNREIKNNPEKYKNFETRRLKHNVKDADGNRYSEAILSEAIFTKFGLKIGDTIPEELTKMLGYRIPTQDKHSMTPLKVVDVLPVHFEGTGIFPFELVYLSGADFDIDSLYIQSPAFWVRDGVAIKHGTEKTISDKFHGFVNSLMNDKTFKIEYKSRTGEDALQQTLRFFKLPTNVKEYSEYKGVNLNNSELNNKILDQQIILSSNDYITESIAYQPVSSKPMELLVEEIDNLLNNTSNDKLLISGLNSKFKSFADNSAGKDGIGIVANALQGFTFLASNKIKRISENSIIVNGEELNEFKYTNNENNRVADILSTILSVMTDNAKDPLAGKMGLSLELLPTFTYLVSLGAPLRTIGMLINIPSIREYSKLLKESNFTIVDSSKRGLSRNDKIEFLLKSLDYEKTGETKLVNQLLKDSENVEIEEETIKSILENKYDARSKELSILLLGKFIQIEKEAKSIVDITNLIKLTKGLESNFTESEESIVNSIYNLGLQEIFPTVPKRDIESNSPFDVKDAVKNDRLLKNNVNIALESLSLANGIFITEAPEFKFELSKLITNLKDNITNDTIKEIRKSFLGFISTRAYKKVLNEDQLEKSKEVINFNLLYPELEGKTFAAELIELKKSKDIKIRENAFIKWLMPIIADSENNSTIDVVSGKSFIKLSADTVNDILDGYEDLFKDPETKKFAVKAFGYLIVKDNLEFKNNSFIKYIKGFIFNDISKGLKNAIRSLSTSIGIEDALGYTMSEIGDEFREIYNRYEPSQWSTITIKNGSTLGIKSFDNQTSKGLMIEDGSLLFDNYMEGVNNNDYLENIFESKIVDKKYLFKFPEYLIINNEKNRKLFKTNIIGEKETWATSARYYEVSQFGEPSVSPFSATLKEIIQVNEFIKNKKNKKSLPMVEIDEFNIGGAETKSLDTLSKEVSKKLSNKKPNGMIIDNDFSDDISSLQLVATKTYQDLKESIEGMPDGSDKTEYLKDLNNANTEMDLAKLLKKICK